jgi:hypothetical protein
MLPLNALSIVMPLVALLLMEQSATELAPLKNMSGSSSDGATVKAILDGAVWAHGPGRVNPSGSNQR